MALRSLLLVIPHLASGERRAASDARGTGPPPTMHQVWLSRHRPVWRLFASHPPIEARVEAPRSAVQAGTLA